MQRIAAAEAETYEKAFAIESYSTESPGVLFLPAFLDMAKPVTGASVLDAGCGSGKGALALEAAGFRPTLLDFVDGRIDQVKHLPFVEQACLWHELKGLSDWVYCCDVLEHVPTEFTMLVVRNLLHAALQGAFFSIALEPDNFGALIGQPLHKTVQPFTWWRDRLAELGEILECRDLITNGLYLVRAR